MSLQPQVVIDLFDKWALNFVGHINPPSMHKTYILVCIDYIIKWMEAKSFPKAIEKAMTTFLYE
jgi:hypothetical protein